MLLKEYKINYNEIDEIAGFELTEYIPDMFKGKDMVFLKSKTELFCSTDFTVTLFLEDIDEEFIDKHICKMQSENKYKIKLYFEYLTNKYLVLSSEEAMMHKRDLEHDLEHLAQVKNLLDVLND